MIDDANDWEGLVRRMRQYILRQVFVAGSGHSGGALSMVEIMAAIGEHWRVNRVTDHPEIVVSKGHAAACLYAWLAVEGLVDEKELDTYRGLGSRLQAHVKPPTSTSPGLNGFYPSGSLTHGLSLAAGAAVAKKDQVIYCVLGDTEMQGGQIWEAALQIAYHHLNNVIAVVDDNGMGNDYRTADTMAVGDLVKRWEACGWQLREVANGNNVNDVLGALRKHKGDGPLVVIATTVKGKGVSFMENDNSWHGKAPDLMQFKLAAAELQMKDEEIEQAVFARDERTKRLPVFFPKEKTPRDAPAEVLIEKMRTDESVVVIAPELAVSTRAARIKEEFPERVYNVGVQEPHAMDMVAGLALNDYKPVILTFTNFVLLRTVDQIFQNIAPFNKQALIIGTHDSLVEDGMSVTPYNHFAIARSFYGSKVLAAADYVEAKGLTAAALDSSGYSFLFIAREEMPLVYTEDEEFGVGQAKVYGPAQKSWQGPVSKVLNIAVVGAPLVWAAQQAVDEIYEQEGLEVGVINMSSLKPLDEDVTRQALTQAPRLAVIEKHSPYGGLYSAIAEYAFAQGLQASEITRYPKEEWLGQSGTPDQQLKHYGYDKASLKKFVLKQARERSRVAVNS